MDASLLALLVAAAIVAVLVFPLGKALYRHPVPFYLAVIVLTALYLWAVDSGVRLTGVRVLAVVMQKGYLASLMLAVVMFCGCLDEGTWLRRRIQPIRGELSILSFVFALGHLATYLPSYLGRLGALFGAHTNVAASFVVAALLTVLFAALTALSLRAVRRRMPPGLWKNLQRAAYAMVALLALHVALALWGSAVASHSPRAMATFAAYMGAVTLYAVLRAWKAMRDVRKKRRRREAEMGVASAKGQADGAAEAGAAGVAATEAGAVDPVA